MADWGGLYLRQDLGASAALAALSYSFFTGGMTLGRVVGDWVNHRIGAVALLRWGALLTGVPLAAMLLIGAPAAALVGLFLVGLGVANGVPLMFSAAGRQPDTPPGPGIAAVSSMGSLGFLAGPPVIGFLADATSLPVGALDAHPRRGRGVPPGAPGDRAHARPSRRRPRRAASRTIRWRCRELRGRHLRLRRRARRLDRRDHPRVGALGRPPRARRRRDPGREPRPARARRRRRARRARRGSRRRRRGCSTPRSPTPRASSPTRAPPACSRCPSSRSPPRARCRSPARGSPPRACPSPACS